MTSSHETLAIASPMTHHHQFTSGHVGFKGLPLHSRHHSFGATPPSSVHRVSRRKSVTSGTTNLAAVAQVVKECADSRFTVLPPSSSLLSNGLGSRPIVMESLPPLHGYPSPPSSLPTSGAGPLSGVASNPTVVFPRKLSATPEDASGAPINGIPSPTGYGNGTGRRTRRASEGAHSPLGGSGEATGRGGVELKCDKCGKGYKHSSCLSKHLWEHTPEWQITSKLLISKHQQVQLLEAASILVSMKPNELSPETSTNSSEASVSEFSMTNTMSSSCSSSEDTPPPPDSYPSSLGGRDISSALSSSRSSRAKSGPKRYSLTSVTGGCSSTKLSSSHHPHAPPIISGSMPTHIGSGSNFPSHFISKPQNAHGRQRSGSFVNTSRVAAVASAASEDESLAAAVELLSCSFGATPISTPAVPPHGTRGLLNSPSLLTESGASHENFLEQLRRQARRNRSSIDDDPMKIEEREEENNGWIDGYNGVRRATSDEMAIDDDDDEEWTRDRRTYSHGSMNGMHRSRSEEEEEGVFGRMEE